ncbi:TraB/GumN family protein [Labrys wisconsinensis]|uniref:Uncharacterized protein YbaP (TraB family) n=1 Tax=Labrys wisconsinensis TaxID=425677 RepID=A0ABU0JB93_9HYPH|nr:TraB/GumN family protein [Labrys wisconsinensis]MDQ0471552.1 uncharacterized protein YbaP (TraB family) [Labrys wisconsinensis]
MPRLRALLLCLALGLPSAAPAATAPPPACAGKDMVAEVRSKTPLLGRMLDWLLEWQIRGVPNGDGILWKIEGKGAAPSYLLGTMHVTDERLIALVPRLDPYFGPGRVLATELGEDLIGPGQYVLAGKLLLRSMATKGDSLAGITDPSDRSAVDEMLARIGLPPDRTRRLAPWFLAIAAGAPACEQERQKHGLTVFDVALTEAAKRAGSRIVALETADEQIDVIASISPAVSARMLVQAARATTSPDDGLATLVGLYFDHRIGLPLSPLASWWTAFQGGGDTFAAALLGGRNAVMRERARPLLERGNTLIAVGAMHLVGKNGLVALFRQDGYTVTKVW